MNLVMTHKQENQPDQIASWAILNFEVVVAIQEWGMAMHSQFEGCEIPYREQASN
jgi:hypothetical protein